MGISDSISSGFGNGGMPGFEALKGGLDNLKEKRSDRRKFDYEENVRHTHQMERDSYAFQHNLANTVLGGAVQMEVDNNRHSNDKDFESHKTNEMGRAFGKMTRYAAKTGAQVTQFGHGSTSVSLNYPAPQPAPTLPTTPAQTNKPKPPPVGNALSPQFSNPQNAPQAQGPKPLRPQP
jgi:hypothetical protein